MVVLFLASCIEPIDFPITEGKKILIVEGMITNRSEPYTVKLTRTAAYENVLDNGLNEPESGATVFVDVIGKGVFQLLELSPGNYSSNPNNFIGEVGETYQLKITTSDGNVYYSRLETLNGNVGFEGVDNIFTIKEQLNEYNNIVDVTGMEINVDFSFDVQNPSYIRWGYSYTRLHPPNNNSIFFKDHGYVNAMEYAEYNRSHISEYNILFIEKPIGVGDLFKYKLDVYQYCISEDVFDFWDLVAKQKENNGTIFDPSVTQIHGNIYSISDPNEVVLGIFSAAGVNVKKIEFSM